VVHRAKSGTLDARGGVRATMAPREGDSLGSAALGGGEGPVMVESSEATFRQAEDDVAFRGGVRAWRGTSLLLADQLRGDRGGRSLAASGTVRTAWRPEAAATAPGAASTDASESSGSSDEARRREPVEIAADHLTYQESERRLRYEGSVSVVQGAQTVTCQLLIIELDAEQQPESYDCSGQAKVVDRALERTVEGRQVVYQPGGGEVEVSGDPVRLVDPKLRVEGPKLWYSVEDGSVRMGPPATPPVPPPTDGTPSETGQ
jgi:lipopolysaccharide transport protein LptA